MEVFSRLSVKQISLYNVGGPHLISWRPGKKKVWCPLGRSGKVLVAQSCPTLCDLTDCNPQLLSPWDSPGKNTGVGSHSLLHGIFLTQGLNLGLLHCRQILYHLSHQGSPRCPVRKREFCLLLPLDLRDRHWYWFCLSWGCWLIQTLNLLAWNKNHFFLLTNSVAWDLGRAQPGLPVLPPQCLGL